MTGITCFTDVKHKWFGVILLKQELKVNCSEINYELCWGSDPLFTAGYLCNHTERTAALESFSLLTRKIAQIFS